MRKDVAFHIVFGDTYGARDGLRVGRTMRDETAAAHAEERRSSVFRHVDRLAELLQRRHQEKRADLRENAAVFHRVLGEAHERLRKPLRKF